MEPRDRVLQSAAPASAFCAPAFLHVAALPSRFRTARRRVASPRCGPTAPSSRDGRGVDGPSGGADSAGGISSGVSSSANSPPQRNDANLTSQRAAQPAARPRATALGPRAAALDSRVILRSALAVAAAAKVALRERPADCHGLIARLQAERRTLRRADAGAISGVAEAAAELERLIDDLTVVAREDAERQRRLADEKEAMAQAETISWTEGAGEAETKLEVDVDGAGAALRAQKSGEQADQQRADASRRAESRSDLASSDEESTRVADDARASELNGGIGNTPGSSDPNGTLDDTTQGIPSVRIPLEAVSKVTDSLREGGSNLIRRASSVGAGLEETMSSYMREDGFLDIDKLRGNIREGIDKFGESWQRLNGLDPAISTGAPEGGSVGGLVTDAKASTISPVRDEAKLVELRSQIDVLEKRLAEASKARELLLRREDQLGKLIRAKEIRAMDDNVSAVRRTLAVRVLQLEMENILASLSDEIERSSFEIMEKRIMIAEFGDIDNRLNSLVDFVDQDAPVLIDDDDVGILACDIQDLKMRLGLDTQVYSSRPDITQVRQYISVSVAKAKAGADFYGRGLRLFWGDCRYALRLIRRVTTGYTLTPREVRTLRRTGRDILTLVPFTVILIAPLTPIGHVLIFGFVQRYWPDFFPSTFSESRQSLMKRHEAYARSIREETNGSATAAGGAVQTVSPWRGKLLSRLISRLPFFINRETSDEGSSSSVESSNVEIQGGNLAVRDDEIVSDVSETDSQGSGADRETGLDLADLAENAREMGSPRRARAAVALDDLHLAD